MCRMNVSFADFLIVVVAIIEEILPLIGTLGFGTIHSCPESPHRLCASGVQFSGGFAVFRVLRVTRVFRMFRGQPQLIVRAILH